MVRQMAGFKSSEVDDDEDQSCKICAISPRRYTCPRCSIGYCTVNCYRSLAHSECSESFYKQCVEEELNVRKQDSEAKRKMLDILKRMHDQALEESVVSDQSTENLAQPDSDDEEEVPDLAERLESVNLDDADAVWSTLTDAERQEFEALVRNGEGEKLLPSWVPWWCYRAKKKFVQELDEDWQDFDYVKNCPQVLEVPTSIDVSAASPCVRFNLLNVLHAYAYVVLYYGGNYHDFPGEAINIFLRLSDNVRRNEIFRDSITSIRSVVQRAIDCQWLPADEQTLLELKAAGNLIVRGPEETNRCFYISAALSDLHGLFVGIKRTRSAPKSSARSEVTGHEFSKRFQNRDEIFGDMDISKKDLRLYLKKLEYYLAWIKCHGQSMCM